MAAVEVAQQLGRLGVALEVAGRVVPAPSGLAAAAVSKAQAMSFDTTFGNATAPRTTSDDAVAAGTKA